MRCYIDNKPCNCPRTLIDCPKDAFEYDQLNSEVEDQQAEYEHLHRVGHVLDCHEGS